MFIMSRSTKQFHSWKCPTTVWRVIILEMHFFVDFTAFGYSNNQRDANLLQNVKLHMLNFENHWHLCFFTAVLITYIKGGSPFQIFLEKGFAMTRTTFDIFWQKLSSFIDCCCYCTKVSYTGSWEPLVF